MLIEREIFRLVMGHSIRKIFILKNIFPFSHNFILNLEKFMIVTDNMYLELKKDFSLSEGFCRETISNKVSFTLWLWSRYELLHFHSVSNFPYFSILCNIIYPKLCATNLVISFSFFKLVVDGFYLW
jgi:hypothetical protein